MDREVVLAVLALLICGPALWALGGWSSPRVPAGARGPIAEEHRRWLGIWLRILPAAVALCALVGWALAEPADAESAPTLAVLLALPFAAIWLRALVRAGRSLFHVGQIAAATVGLLRPRVVVSPELAAALDPAALAAALQHEAAHARHRDPLRIWLAQLATDLQWPWPGACRRFRAWLEALELARDAEARMRGAAGEDLAAAVIAAARAGAAPSLAALDGNGAALARRVAALLAPLPSSEPAPRSVHLIVVAALLGAALLLGASEGEAIVRALLATP